MPRKSAASLEVAVRPAPGVAVRLQPPLHVSEAERAVWLQVVNDLPADTFTPTHEPLLELYCRHVVNARILADETANFQREWLADPDGLKRYDRLLAMAERESRAASAIATRLRITRQSVYASTAGRRQENAKRSHKPWELAT